MSILQFKEKPAAYALGRRVNMEEWNTFTRVAYSDDIIGFGAPVVAVAADDRACVPLAIGAGQRILGIAETSLVLPHPGDAYWQYDNVGICEVGVIGVKLHANVKAGDIARFDVSNKAWTNGPATSTVKEIPGAEFEADGLAGEIGAVRYRRVIPSVTVA